MIKKTNIVAIGALSLLALTSCAAPSADPATRVAAPTQEVNVDGAATAYAYYCGAAAAGLRLVDEYQSRFALGELPEPQADHAIGVIRSTFAAVAPPTIETNPRVTSLAAYAENATSFGDTDGGFASSEWAALRDDANNDCANLELFSGSSSEGG